MELISDQFSELYIHEKSWNSLVAKRAREILNVTPIKVSERPYGNREGNLTGKEFSLSKKRLYLAPHEGHFFRKCPGTQGAACCNYFVLNLGVQCNMNCSYCYLQSYINSPVSQIYTNIEDALIELDETALKFPNSPFRVGTGETIDSLSLDDITHYSKILVQWFSRHPKLTCEFKTKSDNIKNFIDVQHAGNVVVSFSVNPQSIIASEEHGTASLRQRLHAGRTASNQGFPVAFHVDPMIYVSGWKVLYSELVDQITTMFTPKEIRWISIGALRYPPEMKHILRERFSKNPPAALTGELFLSGDGKLRYDQGLRNQMFSHVIGEFKKRDKGYPAFLCMEAPESWLGTFQQTPRQISQIKDLFQPMAAP
ncbi:MAG: radical SAM protein [Oligoflexia bacterium]|nr:radical SAM protein [Oligoflexia bacterium]